jgi:hypothetical protein
MARTTLAQKKRAADRKAALLKELLNDLKTQIAMAQNQAQNTGKITLIDTLRSVAQTAKLIEFELNKEK